MPPEPPTGNHLLADFAGIAEEALRDSGRIMATLRASLDRNGFRRLEETVHRFEAGGQGFTGVVLLAESHVSVHTYPEAGYLAFDLYACGTADPETVLQDLVRELEPGFVHVRRCLRGPHTDASRGSRRMEFVADRRLESVARREDASHAGTATGTRASVHHP